MTSEADDTILAAMRTLAADRRGVTTRELCAVSGHSETDVLAGLARAQDSGHVMALGRSPFGARLYTFATPQDGRGPSPADDADTPGPAGPTGRFRRRT